MAQSITSTTSTMCRILKSLRPPNALVHHPFFVKIANHSLSRKEWGTFLHHDVLYLHSVGNLWTQLAQQSTSPRVKQLSTRLALASHNEANSITQTTTLTPLYPPTFWPHTSTLHAYLDFLKTQVESNSEPAALISLSACWLGYATVGLHYKSTSLPFFCELNKLSYLKKVLQLQQLMHALNSSHHHKLLVKSYHFEIKLLSDILDIASRF